jgi:hypothetical protein
MKMLKTKSQACLPQDDPFPRACPVRLEPIMRYPFKHVHLFISTFKEETPSPFRLLLNLKGRKQAPYKLYVHNYFNLSGRKYLKGLGN